MYLRVILINFQVVLPSGESVVEIKPEFDAIRKCPGTGMIVTGAGPPGSGFDFYSRYFCPKFGINEVKYASFKAHEVIYRSLLYVFLAFRHILYMISTYRGLQNRIIMLLQKQTREMLYQNIWIWLIPLSNVTLLTSAYV